MIEIYEWNGEGYKPLVFTPQWMAAILNWQPLYDLANADEIEVHQQTDEVFVLWRGQGALYYLNEEGQLEVQDLKPGVIYNVPAGVWHGCVGSRDVSWIIVENRDTHLHDTTVRKMNEAELRALRQKAPAWCGE
ncbi:MAG: hypothetical protein Kow0088_25000 [Anaerolineales bacterium]